MSVHTDIIFVRILLAATLLAALSVLGMLVVVFVRAFTQIGVPGWASTMFGDLVIVLVQTLVMIMATSLMVLAGRSQRPIVPVVDSPIFIMLETHLDMGRPRDPRAGRPPTCDRGRTSRFMQVATSACCRCRCRVMPRRYSPAHRHNRMKCEGDSAYARAAIPGTTAQQPGVQRCVTAARLDEPLHPAGRCGGRDQLRRRSGRVFHFSAQPAADGKSWPTLGWTSALDALHLPFAPASVDVFICSNVIHQCRSPMRFLHDIFMVLSRNRTAGLLIQ